MTSANNDSEEAGTETDHATWSGRVLGFLLAGAVGDALGAPIEFLSIAQIRARYGPDGLRDYAPLPSGLGEVTDDTQMTLFTLEGLIKAHLRARTSGVEAAVPAFLTNAYLRWLDTQLSDAAANPDHPGWLVATPGLHSTPVGRPAIPVCPLWPPSAAAACPVALTYRSTTLKAVAVSCALHRPDYG